MIHLHGLPEDRIGRLKVLASIFRSILALAIVLTFFIVLIVIVTGQNDTHTTLQILRDCTQPGHRCYDDSRKATRSVILDIDQVIERTAYCEAKRPSSFPQLRTCVLKGVK